MGKGGKKGKKEVLSSADRIRLANQAKKQAKEDDSNIAWWKEQLGSIEDRPTASKIVAIENLMRNKRTKEGWLSVEIWLYRIHLEFTRWIDDAQREAPAARDRYTVALMVMIKDLYESKELFPTAAKYLAMALIALGFGLHSGVRGPRGGGERRPDAVLRVREAGEVKEWACGAQVDAHPGGPCGVAAEVVWRVYGPEHG